jgi:pimeloyl-ACP methyl ester carboxylesterase
MPHHHSPKSARLETPRGGLALTTLDGDPNAPVVLGLHGLASDRGSSKNTFLLQRCAAAGVAAVTVDYPGHGDSYGGLKDFTMSEGLAAVEAVATHVARPLVVVGSSTGGWLALLVALARPRQVVGVVTVANAADFTETLLWSPLSPAEKDHFSRTGVRTEPRDDAPPIELGYGLVTDGRRHRVLGNGRLSGVRCPVRLLHGMADTDVPWQVSVDVAHEVGSLDTEVLLLPGVDHRFKDARALKTLAVAVAGLPVWVPEVAVRLRGVGVTA